MLSISSAKSYNAMAMKLRFTLHAEEKLLRLTKVGISRKKVMEILQSPERILAGHSGWEIAQGALTNDLMLRVVYEETEGGILVITMYPSERRRYR